MAWVAGCVDAVGYLSLYHLFTAHMSGNMAAMGAYLGEGQWREALYRASPIPFFLLGVIIGTILTEWTIRCGLRSPFSVVLTLEALALGTIIFFGNAPQGGLQTETVTEFYLLAALPALSMGLQSTTFRRVGRYTIRTSYITGTLTALSEEVVKYLFWSYDRTHRHEMESAGLHPATVNQIVLKRIFLSGGLVLGFALGATFGGFAHQLWQLRSLIFPLVALLFVIAFDLIHPLYKPSPLDQKIGL